MTHEEFYKKYNFYPECGEGWLYIIDKLMNKIQENNIIIEPHQIKSKFGGLRFYYHTPFDKNGRQVYNSDDKYILLDELIYEAEVRCSTICEKCGEFIWNLLEDTSIPIEQNINGLCQKCFNRNKL
jgi:hypothetical protein